ncbi:MAG: hypothetical protein ACP5UT_11700 [Bryobacteraceae bacterium]
MRRDDFAIEARIAEAVQAAAGRRARNGENLAEAVAGSQVRPTDEGEQIAAVVGSIVSRLDGLIQPAASPSSAWRNAAASLNPLIGGLLRLFGGGGEEPAPQLPLAPRFKTVRYEAAYEEGKEGVFLVDRDQSGTLRRAAVPATTQVVVQVDALDSHSFLERAPEIAEALRKVLLESDGIRAVLDE